MTQTADYFTPPPELLLEDCQPARPPSLSVLMNPLQSYPDAASENEALILVYDNYAKRQTSAIGLCRRQIQSINEWADEYLQSGETL